MQTFIATLNMDWNVTHKIGVYAENREAMLDKVRQANIDVLMKSVPPDEFTCFRLDIVDVEVKQKLNK